MKKHKTREIIIFVILSIIACVTIFPFLFMVLTTFKDRNEYLVSLFGWPEQFTFNNYKIVWDSFDFIGMTFNSFVITASAVFLSLLVTSMLGFALSKIQFSGKKLITALVVSGMFMPGQVLIIPVYNIMIKLGLVNTYLGLILFYVATSIPFATFLMIANLKNVPNELMESAKIDGASLFRVYRSIALPILMPALATAAILNFISYWNELLYAMVLLQQEEMRTITVGVTSLVNRFGGNTPLLYAGLLLSAIPVILIFFIFQKYLVKGVTGGAVK